MAQIDDFKANLLGGGARANQFRVTITPPSGISIGLDSRRTSFLVKAASLPTRAITEIPLKFRGRTIYMAGDATEPDAWETTFYNDTDFMIKNAIERWSNGINDFALNTGVVSPADYQTDLTVEQLDRDDQVRKIYRFRNAWPTNTGAAIELAMETESAIEEFVVTWRYQHFEASGVTPGITGGAAGLIT
jgi:hypothetical protein